MIKSFFLVAYLTRFAFAFPSLSGMIQDSSRGPIDGAKITVWDAVTGKALQTSSSTGNFSITGITEGDYLFKVEKVSRPPVFGACHLSGGTPHKINVVMLDAEPQRNTPRAGTSLRDSDKAARSSTTLPKVKPAQVKKKTAPLYPDAARRAGVEGTVRIAMIILPDGTLDDLVVLSAPDDSLAVAALMAVRLWRYSPTYLDGQAVETSLTVDVNFRR